MAGGMNRKTSSFLMQDSECELIINCQLDKVGLLTKRLGYTQFGPIADATNVFGIAPYYQSSGTDMLLSVVAGRLYNSETAAILSSNITASAKYEMEPFVDQMFIVGSNGNTYATNLNLSNTVVSDTNNLVGAPKAKYAKVFRDKMYFINVEVSGVQKASRFYYSSIPTNGAITWDPTDVTGDYESVNEDDNEQIMGATVLQNRLIIFKETRMFAFDTESVVHLADTGTTSHRSIATKDGLTFFLNRDGIYVYQYGVPPKRISDKAWDDIIQTLTDSQLANAVGSISNGHYKCFVGDLTIDGTTFPNCEFDYKISINAGTINSYYNGFTCATPFIYSGVERIYVGTATTGEIMKIASSVDVVYSDDGQKISALARSKNYDFGLVEQKKVATTIYPVAETRVGLSVGIRADKGDWFANKMTGFVEKINSFPPEGNRYQFEITESSIHQPFVFAGLVFEILQTEDEK